MVKISTFFSFTSLIVSQGFSGKSTINMRNSFKDSSFYFRRFVLCKVAFTNPAREISYTFGSYKGLW